MKVLKVQRPPLQQYPIRLATLFEDSKQTTSDILEILAAAADADPHADLKKEAEAWESFLSRLTNWTWLVKKKPYYNLSDPKIMNASKEAEIAYMRWIEAFMNCGYVRNPDIVKLERFEEIGYEYPRQAFIGTWNDRSTR